MSKRSMQQAELLGQHSHKTPNGIRVNIYIRDGKYIARGSYEKKRFGVTLGSDISTAPSALCNLLHEIETGTFRRASESRHLSYTTKQVPRHSVRGLFNAFLEEKRKVLGAKTYKDYKARLNPVLEFAEQKKNLKRWSYGAEIDRQFVIDLRVDLHGREVTRNGRSAGALKPMSPSQIINCLETLRAVLNWAKRPEVRQLPPDFINPLTPELIGTVPAKDPLRKAIFPIERKVELVGRMDKWGLHTLSILLILPLRFEDMSGILVSDIDLEAKSLRLGSRLGNSDFNKGKVNVLMPLCDELIPLLQTTIGGRKEGPVFLQKQYWETSASHAEVESFEALESQFQKCLVKAPRHENQTPQDRKSIFRKMLQDMGGVSSRYIGKQLRQLIGPDPHSRPYDMRGSVTTAMKESGMNYLELTYLTEHSVKGILNEYTGLDPFSAMNVYFDSIRPLLDAINSQSRKFSSEN